MSKSKARQLTVAAKAWITPRLLRITFVGDNLQDFPKECASANCKLLVDDGTGSQVTRTYTIRGYRSSPRPELDIDFFIHDEPGPASAWASAAEIGAHIGLKGPSGPKLVNESGDWVLLAGDMSAMPALEANLARLNPGSKGIAVFEVVDPRDQHAVSAPDGIDIHWVINPNPSRPNTVLLDAITELSLPEGIGGVWVAGESKCIKELRRYFREVAGVPRSHLYASGYWQIGLSEDTHQLVKRKEAEATAGVRNT